MTKSDILIIGGGPGGYETALRARKLGMSVTLIERGELGGTCLNRGCIPTKALCRSAEVATLLSHSGEFGLKSSDNSVDFTAVSERKNRIVAELREGVESLMKDVNLIRGEAVFVGDRVISANGELFTADRIIIATGSKPASLNIPGFDLALTSDRLLSLDALPKSLIIIGGGVIGMEFASIFSAFGVEVTVLEYCDEILPPFDKEIAKRLRMSLKRRGINIVTGAQVTAILPDGTVTFLSKGKEKSVVAEICAIAVGRQPVIPDRFELTGAMIERGAIRVDDTMQCLRQDGSSISGLYAIGDVNGRCMLAHAASMHGEVALGLRELTGLIPSAVFTQPECAMVGLTEEACLSQALDFKVGKATFRACGKAVAMGETDGLVKVIVDASSDKILGCHIMGPHAADIIQEATIAMTNGLTAQQVCECVFTHPTLSETLKAALLQ